MNAKKTRGKYLKVIYTDDNFNLWLQFKERRNSRLPLHTYIHISTYNNSRVLVLGYGLMLPKEKKRKEKNK